MRVVLSALDGDVAAGLHLGCVYVDEDSLKCRICAWFWQYPGSSLASTEGSRSHATWSHRDCADSNRLRHFLFTWLKTQGIDDALIQPYSGHASRTSLEIYSRVALADAQHSYDKVIDRFPV